MLCQSLFCVVNENFLATTGSSCGGDGDGIATFLQRQIRKPPLLKGGQIFLYDAHNIIRG